MQRHSLRDALERGPVAFTVFWSTADCTQFKERFRNGSPQIRNLFGGWNRQTRFGRAGVRPGDTIFPIQVVSRHLHLLSRLTVVGIHNDGVTETVRGMLGARLHLDLVVPAEILERWEYAGPNGPRRPKFVVDGEVGRSNAFQGLYRLSAQTASDLFGLIIDHELRSFLGS